MLMASAKEAGAYVEITKEEAAAEARPGSSGSGAVQSSSSQQPYIEERPANIRARHRRFCRMVLLGATLSFNRTVVLRYRTFLERSSMLPRRSIYGSQP